MSTAELVNHRPARKWALSVVAILASIVVFIIPFVFMLLTAVKAQTVPILIANFQTQYGLQWGPMTAMATLYSIPVILLTLVLQRRIVAGLTLGAVKG